jgi:PKD repeat protein
MTGDTGNSAALPSDLTADARITAGQGCAPYDYGRGQVGNTPPAAAVEAKPTTITAGQAVTLDGSGSSDDRQAPEQLTYAWDTDGNGSDDASGQVVTHTYTNAGQYTVRLRVTDADGASDTATAVVTVKAAPPDLQVTGMTTSNPKPKQGDKVTVVVTVKNTGAGAAAASSTRLADGDTTIGTLDTPALAPGASTDVRFTWDLKGVNAITPCGRQRTAQVSSPSPARRTTSAPSR